MIEEHLVYLFKKKILGKGTENYCWQDSFWGEAENIGRH